MKLKPGFLFGLFLLFKGLNCAAQQGIAFPPNPHASWFFLTPTSYAPPPGKAIFQNAMLAGWQYQKTTPRGNTYTIGLIPTLLIGGDQMPVWVSAHRRIPFGGSPKRPAAVANIGGFFMSVPRTEEQPEDRDLSLFYSNFSFGTREKNFAIGGGFVPSGFGKGVYPQAISLHGLTRLGPRSCLVTENYFIHDRGVWMPCSMSGWRFWRKDMALDLSVLVMRFPSVWRTENKALWIPIPWLAFHKTLRYDIFNRGE